MPTITIPPAYNYQEPLRALPMNNGNEPREGRKFINCQINWTVTDNNLGSVHFNMNNNATLELSQVSALVIDNSQCGADIQFVFTDTNTTVTVPAYAPYALVPVFTNSKEWYVILQDPALLGDITRFSVLNYQPAPVTIPTTNHQNVAIADDIPATAGTTQVIPAGTNGTIENLSVSVAMNSNTSGFTTCKFVVQDGSGNNVAVGRLVGSFGATVDSNLIGLNNVSVRFTNGLKFIVSETTIGQAFFDVNAYYRIP